MKKRIKKKIYKRAESKLEAFRAKNNDKRSYCEIANQETVLSSKEKAVFIKEQEKWIRFTQSVLDDITTEELEAKYAAIQPTKDPNGFHLFHAAEAVLGELDFAHFAYEDNRGFFEDADGDRLFCYLLVQYCWKLGKKNAEVDRWEVVAPGYERCINFTIDTTTPEYQEFEKKLYKTLLERLEKK